MADTALQANLKRFMEEAGTNPKRLSLDARLNETAVRDILDGKSKNPRSDTLQKLATQLTLDLERRVAVADLTGELPGLAEEPAAYLATLTDPVRGIADTLLARLGRDAHPELLRLFMIQAALLERWPEGPFDTRAYLAEVAKFVEIYHLPGDQPADTAAKPR